MKKLIVKIIKNSPAWFVYYYLKKKQLRKKDKYFLNQNQNMFRFYSSLVSPRELVFDIGANYGNRTKVLAEIGARVIAFEPQPVCAEYLKSYFYFEKNVQIEPVALGGECSNAIMKISSNSVLSTLSADYIDRSVKSGRFAKDAWHGEENVQVHTLDYYIQQYGCPKFAKIDVEGFEFEVLKGLSVAIPLISLEFATENRNIIMNCIKRLNCIGKYVFQFSEEESFNLLSDKWHDEGGIIEQINSFNKLEWGDIYCLKKSHPIYFGQ